MVSLRLDIIRAHMDRRKRTGAWLLGLATVALLFSGTPATAGDAFLRGGVIFHPSDLGFAGRWRAAFGSDYAMNLGETFYAGFEAQMSVYRQDIAMTEATATVVPANGFVNFKFKGGDMGMRPYAGGGLGYLSTMTWAGGGNSWETQFGYHFLGGIELSGFSLELQLQRAWESGSQMDYVFYVGFVF